MKRVGLTVWAVSIVLLGQAWGAEYDVRVVKDIDYLEEADYPDAKDRLDLYLPEGDERFPVMFFIHGGGLMRGSKDSQKHVGEWFARKGVGTVVVNHRLSPGVMHPAHIQDIAASFAWVHANIEAYGGDAKKIVVAGHSAGAYLAALLALDGRYLRTHKLSPYDIVGAILISGFYHVDRVAPERPKHVWGSDVKGWVDASPSMHLMSSSASHFFLLLYADGDAEDRRKESLDLREELRIFGTWANTYQVADRTHVTIWSKMGKDDDPTSNQALDFIHRVTRRHD